MDITTKTEIQYPEKIILVITTHGILKARESELGNKPDTFTMPEDIKLFKINVSTLGECNFMTEDSVKAYTNIVKRYTPYLIRKPRTSLTDSQIKKKITGITHIIKTKETKEELDNLKENMKELFNKIQRSKKPSDEDLERLQNIATYISNYDKSYEITVANPGDVIMNKIFTRSNIQATKTDWIINAINMKGQPDLLKLYFTQTRRGESSITLQQLVNYLKMKGVKEIFLFDFSCSILQDINLGIELSPRSVRRTRRSSRLSIKGGQTKHYKHKHKLKRYKTKSKDSNRTKRNKYKHISRSTKKNLFGGLYGP